MEKNSAHFLSTDNLLLNIHFKMFQTLKGTNYLDNSENCFFIKLKINMSFIIVTCLEQVCSLEIGVGGA